MNVSHWEMSSFRSQQYFLAHSSNHIFISNETVIQVQRHKESTAALWSSILKKSNVIKGRWRSTAISRSEASATKSYSATNKSQNVEKWLELEKNEVNLT